MQAKRLLGAAGVAVVLEMAFAIRALIGALTGRTATVGEHLSLILAIAFATVTAACGVAYWIVQGERSSALYEMRGMRFGERWHVSTRIAWTAVLAFVLLLPLAALTFGLFLLCELAVFLTMIPFFVAWKAEGPELSSVRRQERALAHAHA